MKFKEMFVDAVRFSDGSYVLDGTISKETAREMFEDAWGDEVSLSEIEEGRVRFGYPPEEIEDSEYLDKPCWYSGSSGKGSMAVWIFNN